MTKFIHYFVYDLNTIYTYSPKVNLNNWDSKINEIVNQKSDENSNKKSEVNLNSDIKIKHSPVDENNISCLNTNIFNEKAFRENSSFSNKVFLNTKRIKKITTPISTKVINSSPFREKTSLLIKKNNSAFRNLQNAFEEKPTISNIKKTNNDALI